MDRADNGRQSLAEALRDLAWINRHLGGIRTLRRTLAPHLSPAGDRPLLLLDVGAGGADLARQLADDARRTGRGIEIVAVERDATTASLAQQASRGWPEISIVRADARSLPFRADSFDLVIASLFLHHFDEREAAALLVRFVEIARRAVVINDLRRHYLPWVFTHLFARLTRRGEMFRHDGPISVLRGFTPDELRLLARFAGAKRVRVERRWPFRLALTLEVAD